MRLDRSTQWTLAHAITVEGVALHTGEHVRLEIAPAPPDHGIVFHRTDLVGEPSVAALVEHVVDTTLSTTIAAGPARVQTIEHLMAALWATGVCNADIFVDGPELPILDGSSRYFINAVRSAGRLEQGRKRTVVHFDTPLEVSRHDRSVLLMPNPDQRVEVTCVVDYQHPHAGAMLFEGPIDEDVFCHELADARTFCFQSDVEAMRRAGLARGGSLDNAVIIGDAGPLRPLRFRDEPVRHKVLDLVGDLALVGFDWTGTVVAAKAGHPLHVELASAMRAWALSRGLVHATRRGEK
ncbi:MAG: UDP-3-O-acyl-N-acetylglucosamine deacetylase [bacterium]|nr:UDP-3-O-acyl-N-acetylglucosamine deacetylase [bacterium]